MRKLPWEIVVVIIAMLLMLWWLSAGCHSITGGTSQKSTTGVRTEVRLPDGATYTHEDHRDNVATTQPSAMGTGSSTPKIGQADGDGGIGGVSFDTVKGKSSNIALGMVFLAAAVGLFWIGRRIEAVVVAGLGVLAFIAPAWLVGIALVCVVGYLVWTFRKYLIQLIHGNDDALAIMPKKEAEEAKLRMAKRQDESLQVFVKAHKRSKPTQ